MVVRPSVSHVTHHVHLHVMLTPSDAKRLVIVRQRCQQKKNLSQKEHLPDPAVTGDMSNIIWEH